MLILKDISYTHSNKNLLFENINLTVNHHEKIALVGNNGSGKSTLLKIIAKKLHPLDGKLNVAIQAYYVPQIFGQYNHFTIGQALGIEDKLKALKEILAGVVTEENYTLLNDDWQIEERCNDALKHWQLTNLDLTQKMETLSGGQKARVFLAGITIHQPTFILLDEPSNHLDIAGRQLLYEFIQTTKSTLIVVSHDRKLLNLLNMVCELNKFGITVYGGNYDFYCVQKKLENDALNHDLENKEKALRKAKEKERETSERQQKLDARGKKKQEKAGIARIMMNTLRNNAENSTSKTKSVHSEKIENISMQLHELRSALPDIDKMKFGFNNSVLHKGKKVFVATDINYCYNDHLLWKENLTFDITSGERIVLKGHNGSGKTTLIKIILGNLNSNTGTIYRAENRSVYIDQDYSIIDNQLKVYEQAQQFNTSALQEYEIKTRLNRFLFTKNDWDKSCKMLSGGEKMRLMLCCLTISNESPDIIILDEPTNNLDIQNIEILTAAIKEYQGTLIVVSHDEYFLKQIDIENTIQL
ncbi:MAG: ABC-F family ATP-binding cassette domain-containing protein [Bacteroidota bacterium]